MSENNMDNLEYNPDYPAKIEDALKLLLGYHEEVTSDDPEYQTDFLKGYRTGLRLGINALKKVIELEEDGTEKIKKEI